MCGWVLKSRFILFRLCSRLAAAWIVPACSTRIVLEMPPVGCWLACPVIWKLVLAYHNSAYKHAILCVAGCSSRGFRMRNRATCIGIQEARNAPRKGSPEMIILLLQPQTIVWASAARLQACSLLEGNRQNRPE